MVMKSRRIDSVLDGYDLPFKVECHHPSLYTLPNKWIDENLKGKWSSVGKTLHTLLYEFELEEDAIAFKLRWV